MLSENLFMGKYDDADQFRHYELVETLPAQFCGDWGYLPADIDGSCIVSLGDLATVTAQWLLCDDPENPDECVRNW